MKKMYVVLRSSIRFVCTHGKYCKRFYFGISAAAVIFFAYLCLAIIG